MKFIQPRHHIVIMESVPLSIKMIWFWQSGEMLTDYYCALIQIIAIVNCLVLQQKLEYNMHKNDCLTILEKLYFKFNFQFFEAACYGDNQEGKQ